MDSRKINYWVVFLCLIGLGLSIYSYMVELAAEQDENYTAMCDIGEHMSCTKAFMSPYGKGFGIIGPLLGEDSPLNKPNSLAGIFFYSLVAVAVQLNSKFVDKLTLGAVLLSNVASVYFASILIFVLQDLCIICVSTYVVNFLNGIFMYKKVYGKAAKGTKVKSN